MRLLKVGPEGPPSLVWICRTGSLVHVWIGPLGAHIPLTRNLRGAGLSWCSDWWKHPNPTATPERMPNMTGADGESQDRHTPGLSDPSAQIRGDHA